MEVANSSMKQLDLLHDDLMRKFMNSKQRIKNVYLNALVEINSLKRAHNISGVYSTEVKEANSRALSVSSFGIGDDVFYDARAYSFELEDDGGQIEIVETSEDEPDSSDSELPNRFADFSPPSKIERRQVLPSKVVGEDIAIVSILRQNVGKDLASITFPVSMNEPLNSLQRMCESLDYSELLDKAAEAADSLTRLVYLSAFVVSTYSYTAFRSNRKPFNPLLCETFECLREDKGICVNILVESKNGIGFKFLAEKVSHYPPIFASHMIGKDYIYWENLKPKSKFWGKSLELYDLGLICLEIPKTGDVFSW